MPYQDLLLHLTADGPEGFAIRVLSSPAGEAAARSQTLPADGGWARIARELEHQLDTERARRRPGDLRHVIAVAGATPPMQALRDLEDVGRRLFDVLFPAPIRDRLRESLGLAGAGTDGGLRLRIQMDVDDPSVARLLGLPWEYLFDGGYLGLRRSMPIVRSLDLAGPRRAAELDGPLRILGVLSEPNDLPPLRLLDERAALTATWTAQGGVEVEWLSNPNLEALCRTLLHRPAQVLHFLGHGGLDPKRREGQLYFTDSTGRSEPLAASTLAVQLADFTSLKLVFLNACQTAATALDAPFAGVATALLRTGMPAVIAMQAPIPDGAAIAFAAAVYERLAAGDPIDRAMTEGRLALHRRDPRSMVWGIPVLYLRGGDLRVSGPVRAPAAAAGRRRPTRSLAAAAVAALVALGGGAGVAWRASQRVSESPGGEPALREEQDDTDRKGGRERESEVLPIEPRPDPPPEEQAEPGPPRPAPPATVELHDGRSSFLEGVGAHATADFLQLGYDFVRITVSPSGASPTIQAVMGPTTVEAISPEGTLAIDVLAIDWESRTVTVRGRIASAPSG